MDNFMGDVGFINTHLKINNLTFRLYLVYSNIDIIKNY